jgi:hypothetical protein
MNSRAHRRIAGISLSAAFIPVLLANGCSRDRSATASQPSPSSPTIAVPAAAERRLPTRSVSAVEIAAARCSSATPHPHDFRGFDRAGYVADPGAYLAQIAGGRCYEVCAPAADVALLAPAGPTSFIVRTGEQATFVARTEPGMPVTFTSFGLGEFTASGLQTVTVAADGAGEARASFRASAGTVGNCLITAGSPVRAGTLQFLVTIPE